MQITRTDWKVTFGKKFKRFFNILFFQLTILDHHLWFTHTNFNILTVTTKTNCFILLLSYIRQVIVIKKRKHWNCLRNPPSTIDHVSFTCRLFSPTLISEELLYFCSRNVISQFQYDTIQIRSSRSKTFQIKTA